MTFVVHNTLNTVDPPVISPIHLLIEKEQKDTGLLRILELVQQGLQLDHTVLPGLVSYQLLSPHLIRLVPDVSVVCHKFDNILQYLQLFHNDCHELDLLD